MIEAHETLEIDGVHLELMHVAPAHTDGDLIVYLPAQKLVFAGDLLAPNLGAYPGIHANKHGTSLGWMQFIGAMLALDADLFISGHGEPQSREQVLARLRAAEQRRARIKTLVEAGKSLPEVQAALQDPPPTGVARMFPTFTETTYDELVNAARATDEAARPHVENSPGTGSGPSAVHSSPP